MIDLNASTVIVDGEIQASGQNGWGLTLEEPFELELNASTGAGGSIQVHADKLEGDGKIQADGGVACVEESESVSPSLASYCTEIGTNQETGGGGLVLIQAPEHSLFTGQITAGGGQKGYVDGAAGIVTGP